MSTKEDKLRQLLLDNDFDNVEGIQVFWDKGPWHDGDLVGLLMGKGDEAHVVFADLQGGCLYEYRPVEGDGERLYEDIERIQNPEDFDENGKYKYQ